MAINNSMTVYIDGISRTAKTVTPLKWGNFLDERLDECHLALRGVKKEVFTPLTPVEIHINNEKYWKTDKNRDSEASREEVKYYIVANDNATETQIGSGLYDHDLYLIEVTKAAECFVVDTITFTNDLGKNYTENASLVDPVWE